MRDAGVVAPQRGARPARPSWQAHLFVADDSLFPTSLGANPQLSIYAVAARVAEGIANTLRT